MKRILIIGSGGAGKSTLARRLSEITKIEVIHLDKLYWQPNWVEPPKDEWQKTVEEIIKKDSWIMDGNFSGTLETRLQACDTVIFLDFPPIVCLFRVLKRRLRYQNTNRPDMAAGCNEKVDLKFLGWVWNYRKRNQMKIERFLKDFESNISVFRLISNNDVENFFSEFNKNHVES